MRDQYNFDQTSSFNLANTTTVNEIITIKQTIVDAQNEIVAATKEAGNAQEELASKVSHAKDSLSIFSNLVGMEIPEGLQGLITESKLLGPALEAAYPVGVGLILGQMLVDVTGKAINFHAEIQRIADYMRTDWFSALGMYFDGTADRIREAQKRSEEYLKEAQEFKHRSEQADVELIGLKEGPVGVANDALTKATKTRKKLQEQLDHAKQTMDADAREKQEVETIVVGDPHLGLSLKTQIPTAAAKTAQEQHQPDTFRYRDLQKQVEYALKEEEIATLKLAQAKEKRRAQDEQQAAERRARQQELMRQEQQALISTWDENIRAQEATYGRSTQQEVLYWRDMIGAAEKGTDSYKHALAKLRQAVADDSERIHQMIVKGRQTLQQGVQDDAEMIRKMQEISAMLGQQESAKDQETDRKLEAAEAEYQRIQQQNANQLAEAKIEQGRSTGRLTDRQAADQLTDLHTSEYGQQVDQLLEDYQKLEKITDPKERALAEQNLMNRAATIGGQRDLQVLKDVNTKAQAIAAPYLNASRLITGSFTQSLNSWISGSESFSKAMRSAWQSIAMGAIGNMEKMGQKWIEHQIMLSAQHQAAKEMNVQTDLQANARSEAADKESALKKQLHAASVAAGKAWQSFADIPVVGYALGAAAAAATFSGVMALASFDVGTPYVPRTGVAMIHEGERILTAADNRALMQMMLGNGNKSGDSLSVSHTVNMNGYSDTHFKNQLNRNTDHVLNAVARAARRRGNG